MSRTFAKIGRKSDFVKKVEPVATNIVIFYLNDTIDELEFIQKLKDHNILLIGMGEGKLRFVTHLDYTEAMHKKMIEMIPLLFN